MTSSTLHGYLPATPSQTGGFWKRLHNAVMAHQTRRADEFVGSFLAHKNPAMAQELGYDVEKLKKMPLKAACF
ncbi:hypothetical protein GCM10007276_19690 [Agaricicola taiwanensis]|uniref:Uncharacterized protein n=2 Tax=Agaricicola taiwanensis TaxID=591372 RepID=A0A8J2W3V0_9RHOB|nr:hypothetical protein GCM10007276_19690 [Agaricicola taiwanensis]